MINPLDYLFYKIYKAWSFGGGTPTRHLVFMDMLLLTNLLTIYILIVGEFPSDAFFYGVGALILMFTSISYFSSKKEKKVCAKFEKESEKSRMIGNFVVICYVILTFVSVIWVFKTYGKA